MKHHIDLNGHYAVIATYENGAWTPKAFRNSREFKRVVRELIGIEKTRTLMNHWKEHCCPDKRFTNLDLVRKFISNKTNPILPLFALETNEIVICGAGHLSSTELFEMENSEKEASWKALWEEMDRFERATRKDQTNDN